MPNGDVCEYHTEMAERMAAMEVRLAEEDRRMTAMEQHLDEACKQIAKANLPQLTQDVRDLRTTVIRWSAVIAVGVTLLSIFGNRLAAAIFGG